MLIWLLNTGEPLPLKPGVRQMRTATLARHLAAQGHSVVWWSSAFDHYEKDFYFEEDTDIELEKNILIKAIKGSGYKRNVSLARLRDHALVAERFAQKAEKMPRPDLILASMPVHRFALEGANYAKKHNLPVVVDIRDPWPDLFLDFFPAPLKPFARWALNAEFRILQQLLQKADGITAVSQAFLDWGLGYAKRHKRPTDRVFYLGAPALQKEKPNAGKITPFLPQMKKNFAVIFIGTFAKYHNPAILVETARNLKDKNIVFVLAGSGEFFEQVKQKANDLDNVFLPGWLEQNEIQALLGHADLGVCPTDYQANLFPNKAFTYFSAGLPVVSAFQGDLKAFCEKQNAGLYYPPRQTSALTQALKFCTQNPQEYQKMAQNARLLFAEKFESKKIYQDFLNYLENFPKNSPKAQEK